MPTLTKSLDTSCADKFEIGFTTDKITELVPVTLKNYLKFIPIIFILFSCSDRGSIASLQTHNAIELLPAHPNEQNYDYLVSIRNSRNFGFDLNEPESRSQVLNYLMENVCPEYQITYEQTIDMPESSSKLRDFKNYYYFLECDRPTK